MTHLGWARFDPKLDSDSGTGQKKGAYKLRKSPNAAYDTYGYHVDQVDVESTRPNGYARAAYERSATIIPYIPRSAYATELPIVGLPSGFYTQQQDHYITSTLIPRYQPQTLSATAPSTSLVPLPSHYQSRSTEHPRAGIELILFREERRTTFLRIRL